MRTEQHLIFNSTEFFVFACPNPNRGGDSFWTLNVQRKKFCSCWHTLHFCVFVFIFSLTWSASTVVGRTTSISLVVLLFLVFVDFETFHVLNSGLFILSTQNHVLFWLFNDHWRAFSQFFGDVYLNVIYHLMVFSPHVHWCIARSLVFHFFKHVQLCYSSPFFVHIFSCSSSNYKILRLFPISCQLALYFVLPVQLLPTAACMLPCSPNRLLFCRYPALGRWFLIFAYEHQSIKKIEATRAERKAGREQGRK